MARKMHAVHRSLAIGVSLFFCMDSWVTVQIACEGYKIFMTAVAIRLAAKELVE